MSELQAAFGGAQLERLENIAAKRAALGTLLTEELTPLNFRLIWPPDD